MPQIQQENGQKTEGQKLASAGSGPGVGEASATAEVPEEGREGGSGTIREK